MAEEQKGAEYSGNFVDSLREIQGEYIMLSELYEKEKSYGQKLSDMMKALQYEVDATIPIRPEAIGEPCREAYLVSEAVVVLVDASGNRISRPLYRLPASTIISVIEECTPELRRLLFEKRRAEGNKVRSLERVLKELKKAQATFKQAKRDELEGTEDEPKETKERIEDEKPLQKEQQEVTTQLRTGKEGFAFKGSFGDKREMSDISP
jgi:gas vesicle protein